jgi:hypothetical protein
LLGPPGTPEEKKLFLVDLGLGKLKLQLPSCGIFLLAQEVEVLMCYSLYVLTLQPPGGETVQLACMLSMINVLMFSGKMTIYITIILLNLAYHGSLVLLIAV